MQLGDGGSAVSGSSGSANGGSYTGAVSIQNHAVILKQAIKALKSQLSMCQKLSVCRAVERQHQRQHKHGRKYRFRKRQRQHWSSELQ